MALTNPVAPPPTYQSAVINKAPSTTDIKTLPKKDDSPVRLMASARNNRSAAKGDLTANETAAYGNISSGVKENLLPAETLAVKEAEVQVAPAVEEKTFVHISGDDLKRVLETHDKKQLAITNTNEGTASGNMTTNKGKKYTFTGTMEAFQLLNGFQPLQQPLQTVGILNLNGATATSDITQDVDHETTFNFLPSVAGPPKP